MKDQMKARTVYTTEIECVEEASLEGIIPEESNSIPLEASFFLEDVEMWKETGDPDYPCRVHMYSGRSYGLWTVTYKEFSHTMDDFLK